MAKKDREYRSTGKRPQGKKFLVVVEGVVSEPEYIHAVMRLHRVNRDAIKIESGNTDPIGIVNRAKKLMKATCKADQYDEAWCVFDVEAKLDQKARFGLQAAYDAANGTKEPKKIHLAMSNPCFEIWLLWHETPQTAFIDSDRVQSLCRSRGITDENDGKHIRDAGALIEKGFAEAKSRACEMMQIHDRNVAYMPEDRNPSSGMYALVDAICAAFPLRK